MKVIRKTGVIDKINGFLEDMHSNGQNKWSNFIRKTTL